MTEAIYLEVTEMAETTHKGETPSFCLRNVETSWRFSFWLSCMAKTYSSNTEKRREAVKAKIQDIYDESKQNYGAPKITKEYVNQEKSSLNVPLVSI